VPVIATGWNRPDKLPSLLANGQSAPVAVLFDFVSDLTAELHDLDYADRAGVEMACAFADGTYRARWNANPLDVIGWMPVPWPMASMERFREDAEIFAEMFNRDGWPTPCLSPSRSIPGRLKRARGVRKAVR